MRVDIAIVGGGVVGGSLACALSGSGLRVTVVEPRKPSPVSHDGFDARVYALGPSSRDFLDRIGAWPFVAAARIAPVRDMLVHGDDGASRLEFSAYRSGVPELAAIVEESNLQQAIAAALASREDVQVLQGLHCETVRWESDVARVTLSDGASLEARLVVAADGADSRIRAAAGISVNSHDYDQQGVVANFTVQRRHDGIARQWFRHDGVLALLPLPGMQVSMVWSTGNEHAQALLAMPADKLAHTVSEASAHSLGELQPAGPARSFPLRRQRAEAFAAPRLALVGDAAHNVHPLAGQGLNLGLADADILSSVLRARGPETDCGNRLLLRRYERARKEDVVAMESITDGLQALFNSRLPGLQMLRNAGLSMTNRIPPIKRFLVKRALGHAVQARSRSE